MAAAPTLEKLFDIQANVEDAFATYLTANGLSAYATRSTSDLPDARIIVHAEVGAAQGHCATSTMTYTGSQEQDWFNLTVQFQIQTDRAIADDSPDANITGIHDYWCARLRVLMLRGAINGTLPDTTALSLPYYIIPVLSYSGEQYDVTDDALDTTTQAYAAQLQFNADAWPDLS